MLASVSQRYGKLCLNCGCGEESNRHGNAANLTAGDVKQAMKSAAHKRGGKGREATAHEIKRMVKKRK